MHDLVQVEIFFAAVFAAQAVVGEMDELTHQSDRLSTQVEQFLERIRRAA